MKGDHQLRQSDFKKRAKSRRKPELGGQEFAGLGREKPMLEALDGTPLKPGEAKKAFQKGDKRSLESPKRTIARGGGQENGDTSSRMVRA